MTEDGSAGRAADLDRLAAVFSQARARLVRIAYAILGTHAEAEDVVADCWLRLVAADEQQPVRDVESWAVVAVSRMALDVLRSARVRRERYVGPWLPEPVVSVTVAGERVARVDIVRAPGKLPRAGQRSSRAGDAGSCPGAAS